MFFFKLALISLYALHSGLVEEVHKGDYQPLALNDLTMYVGDVLRHMYKKTGERTPGKSPRTSRTPARTSTGRSARASDAEMDSDLEREREGDY